MDRLHTHNPWWGCHKVSLACQNCYAATIAQVKAKPMGYFVEGEIAHLWGKTKPRFSGFSDKHYTDPFAWDRKAQREGVRRRVFCGSMMDWAEDREDLLVLRTSLWNTIRETPNLDWLMLTKRPENILKMLPADWGKKGWQHVWMGTTVEDNNHVWRADYLRKVPAVIRFISYEPALGSLEKLNLKGLHWLIYGGESATSSKLRPDNIQWAKDIKARCEKAGVVFHYKQDSATPGHHIETMEGKLYHEFPRGRMPLVVV